MSPGHVVLWITFFSKIKILSITFLSLVQCCPKFWSKMEFLCKKHIWMKKFIRGQIISQNSCLLVHLLYADRHLGYGTTSNQGSLLVRRPTSLRVLHIHPEISVFCFGFLIHQWLRTSSCHQTSLKIFNLQAWGKFLNYSYKKL